MVLLKRKLQREQICRNPEFRALMAMVFKDHESLLFENEVGPEVGSIWELYVFTQSMFAQMKFQAIIYGCA
jgi:hypothetical protein